MCSNLVDRNYYELAFARRTADQCAIVPINAAGEPAPFEVAIPSGGRHLVDWLNPGEAFPISDGRASIDTV